MIFDSIARLFSGAFSSEKVNTTPPATSGLHTIGAIARSALKTLSEIGTAARGALSELASRIRPQLLRRKRTL